METQLVTFKYTTLLQQVKRRVRLAQQRAIYSANEEMLSMYWDIGKMLSEAQKEIGWGNGALKRLAVDMKNEFPDVKGFSVRNCQYMMQFYREYNRELTLPKDAAEITQPPVAQLPESNTQAEIAQLPNSNAKLPVSHLAPITKPSVSQLPKYNFTLPITKLSWAHNILLIKSVKDIRARYWYMIQTITNHWSRDYLAETIKLDYYGKHGALANNFSETLAEPDAAEVGSMLKDPYIFDMLTFTKKYDEQDIELGLVKEV